MSRSVSYYGEKKSVEHFKAKLAKEEKFVGPDFTEIVTEGSSGDSSRTLDINKVPSKEGKYGGEEETDEEVKYGGEEDTDEVIPSSIDGISRDESYKSTVYDFDESDVNLNTKGCTGVKSFRGEMKGIDQQLYDAPSSISSDQSCSVSLLSRSSSTSRVSY